MKLEIEKQTQAGGNIYYHILKDGFHVTGTTKMDYGEVFGMFNNIKKMGDIEIKEIILSEEIEEKK